MLDERLSMQQLSAFELNTQWSFLLIVLIMMSVTDEDRQTCLRFLSPVLTFTKAKCVSYVLWKFFLF